jgi:tetratricopeptide (TPR) repeat protein
MKDKIVLWFKFRWPWLIPFAITLLITGIWVEEQFVNEPDRMTPAIVLTHPTIKDLQIVVQYPSTITFDDTTKSSKSLTIFSARNSNSSSDYILINFKAPIGLITFLDKDRNRQSSFIKIPLRRDNVPVTLWLEPTNLALSASPRRVHIETSIFYSQSPDGESSRVPALDLYMTLESRWRQLIRQTARSGLGTLAPLSLVGLLLGFSARTYLAHKRIQPKYADLQNARSSKRWDRAAIKCREIIEIEPIYDDIQSLYKKVRDEEEEQNVRLSDISIKAKGFYASRNWSEAKRLMEEIRKERYDYSDEIANLLADVEGKLNEAKELKELYDSAISASLTPDIQNAIKDLRRVIAINPDYEDAQDRLDKFEAALSRKISSEPTFMRMLLAKPQIGLSYIANFMDATAKTISKEFLKLPNDESVTVRYNTAKIASRMRSPIAKEVLQSLAEDRDQQVRAIASEGLIPRETVSDLIERLSDSDSWREAGTKLIEIGEEAVRPLVSVLADDWPIWERAMEILQAMRGLADEEFTAALHDNSPLIRERVSLILKNEEDESSQE